MAAKMWGGRFAQKTDALVNKFNSSIGFDHKLHAYDVDGSIAHCRVLTRREIITEEEAVVMIEALGQIKRELERGQFPFTDGHEDIHSMVESILVDKIGSLGEKIHTGRSRNDQVALDVRMYVRDAVQQVINLIKTNQIALVALAEKNMDVIMPGYTHMQRAQPVLLSHHLLAYYEMLGRDRERFEESFKRVNVLPLGSAALAGTTFELDRDAIAADLGFERISRNSMDAVSDRDFVMEFLFNASMVMMHLSRLSEELVLWSTQEFGFAIISDSFCTGSSIMPQKKNPDMPELIRGKTGRVYGHLMGLLTTFKGLPLTYNKDMQEDKEALFDGADTVAICLEVMGRLLGEIDFDRERLEMAVSRGHLAATDLADYLVRKGITFREAHEIVGKMVLSVINKGKELRDLTLEEMKGFTRQIGEDVYAWLDPLQSPGRRNSPGGTGPERVRIEIESAKKELGI